MKARTESHSDSICDNDSLENYSPSSTALKLALNRNVHDKEDYHIVNQRLYGYSRNGVPPRAVSPTRYNYSVISNDVPNKDYSFDGDHALEEAPEIFNTGSRGPETFVYYPSLKPTTLYQTEDPYKTFVITPENDGFVTRKNSHNQMLAMNGFDNQIKSDMVDDNEFPSYVIERREESENGDMSDKRVSSESSGFHDADEVDGEIVSEPVKVRSEIFETGYSKQSQFNDTPAVRNLPNSKADEGELCDNNVQSRGEKTGDDSAVLSFDRTITGKKEQTFSKLQDELEKAHQELKLKDEEVARLTRIREDVERELEELTASLFQEAHKMVAKAKEKQAVAEKSLTESQMKVDVLTAEVLALKTLVLTSTPSRPNPHLHPQIGKEENAGGVNIFNKKHRRSPSHFNLKYGRENSPPESPVRSEKVAVAASVHNAIESPDLSEVDPTVYKEFLNWSLNCKLDKTDLFIDRIYREDINLCLDFSNRGLAEEVQKAIETRNIFIEALTDKSKTIFPRKCALLDVSRQCHYRMKLGDQDTWYNISQMCRNRIIAVCDFINYLRYIELGLVKSSAHEIFWEIMRLRKEMVLARLGLSLPSS